MKIRFAVVLACLVVQTEPLAAITLDQGEVIRGAYAFPTFGSATVEPTSFLLRLSPLDLFGNGDSVGIRYLDAAQRPLSFSRFDSVGTALDPTVGILFEANDMLPPVLVPSVPSSGFIEISALAGSFDVNSINLFATEMNILRGVIVRDFERIKQAQAPVPLPSAGGLMLLALAGASGLARFVRRKGTA